MGVTSQPLKCASLFRIWDAVRHAYNFADLRPTDSYNVEAWTSRFDRQGRPIYENDILSIHHDWRLGWVRALVERQAGASDFSGRVTGPDGVFHVAAFEFSDAYVDGNLRQHPQLLVPAVAQFAEAEPPGQLLLWNTDLRLPGHSSKTRSPWKFRLRFFGLLSDSEPASRSHAQPAAPSFWHRGVASPRDNARCTRGAGQAGR